MFFRFISRLKNEYKGQLRLMRLMKSEQVELNHEEAANPQHCIVKIEQIAYGTPRNRDNYQAGIEKYFQSLMQLQVGFRRSGAYINIQLQACQH